MVLGCIRIHVSKYLLKEVKDCATNWLFHYNHEMLNKRKSSLVTDKTLLLNFLIYGKITIKGAKIVDCLKCISAESF